MGDNWTTDVRPGYRTKTLQYKGCTITVHRPILSDEERARREQEVVTAMASAMRDYIFKKEATA